MIRLSGRDKMFAYNGGLRLIAAGMNIEFKALQRNIRLFSKLNITYHANRIHLTADKEIVINGGGSSTHWTAASIESATLGKWSVYSASQSMPQAKSMPVSMPTLPNIHPEGPYSETVNLTSLLATAAEEEAIYDDATVAFKNPTGHLVAHGNTDEEGASVDVFRDQSAKLASYVGHGVWLLKSEGHEE
ncbi:DUF2345 domain-containing protein [Methylovorus mays]|uniref:DUF2345 domain-containing protein n=1 Tax=Methylovorus mays TaxID=184077 RepID=UPI001E3EFCA6|nr:DUF2345 domain-containing protein [Methylovorus mays]MCB5207043.1 DUF2345 domain-containing protein [Methylovorus mays]